MLADFTCTRIWNHTSSYCFPKSGKRVINVFFSGIGCYNIDTSVVIKAKEIILDVRCHLHSNSLHKGVPKTLSALTGYLGKTLPSWVTLHCPPCSRPNTDRLSLG